MNHDGQICAALPMTQVSITAWYCHVHQAWDYRACVSVQTGEDDLRVLHTEELSLGPFDGTDALLVAVTEWLSSHAQPHRLEV